MASEVLVKLHFWHEYCCAPAGPYHERLTRLLREERKPYWDNSPEVEIVTSVVKVAEEIPRLSNNAIADFYAFLKHAKETDGEFPPNSILARALVGVEGELLYFREPPCGEHGMVVLSDVPWKPFRSSAAKLCHVEVVVARKRLFHESLPATLCNVESIAAGNCPAVLKSMLCKAKVVNGLLFIRDNDPEFNSTTWSDTQFYRHIANAWAFNAGRVTDIPGDELELLLEAADALEGNPGSIAAQMGDAARRELDRRRRAQVMITVMLARERYCGAAPNALVRMLAELPSRPLEMVAAAMRGANTT